MGVQFHDLGDRAFGGNNGYRRSVVAQGHEGGTVALRLDRLAGKGFLDRNGSRGIGQHRGAEGQGQKEQHLFHDFPRMFEKGAL